MRPSLEGLPNLLPPHWKEEVARWIQQDMPKWDVGGFVVGAEPHHATLLGKSEGVLAGVPFATFVFEYCGCAVEWLRPEGHLITAAEAAAKAAVAKVSGPTRAILMAERTALNILSRASGVASAAHAAMEVARAHGWHGRVAGTRKTTPGFGLVEKYALLVGGADTHRMDLSSAPPPYTHASSAPLPSSLSLATSPGDDARHTRRHGDAQGQPHLVDGQHHRERRPRALGLRLLDQD